jgi:hypothetical protein
MDELKACPFCGGTEIYAEVSYVTKEFRIYCASPDCDCVAEMRLSFDDAGLGDGSIIDFKEMTTIIQQLVDLWNTRT